MPFGAVVLLWIVFLSQACIGNWEVFTSPPCPTPPPSLEKERKGSISVVVLLFAWKTWWWAIGCQFRCLLNFISSLCEAYETQEEGSGQEPSLPSLSMCSTGWVSLELAFFWASDRFLWLRGGIGPGCCASLSENVLVMFLLWSKKPCLLFSLGKQLQWIECSIKGFSCLKKKIFPGRQMAKSKPDTWVKFVKYLIPDQNFKFFILFLVQIDVSAGQEAWSSRIRHAKLPLSKLSWDEADRADSRGLYLMRFCLPRILNFPQGNDLNS